MCQAAGPSVASEAETGGVAIAGVPATRTEYDPLAGLRGGSAPTPPASKPPRKAPGKTRKYRKEWRRNNMTSGVIGRGRSLYILA